MPHYNIHTSEIKDYAKKLKIGDTVALTGTIYTARDAAHKRIVSAIDNNEALPFNIDGAIIYYAGPTPTREGEVIGSCGPTTSGRMDVFSPLLIEKGLSCMIGKGVRDEKTAKAMAEHGAVYLAAIGGAGAIIASSVKKLEVIAFDDLGCESVKRLTVEDFPAIVAMDSFSGNLYISGTKEYRKN